MMQFAPLQKIDRLIWKRKGKEEDDEEEEEEEEEERVGEWGWRVAKERMNMSSINSIFFNLKQNFFVLRNTLAPIEIFADLSIDLLCLYERNYGSFGTSTNCLSAHHFMIIHI